METLNQEIKPLREMTPNQKSAEAASAKMLVAAELWPGVGFERVGVGLLALSECEDCKGNGYRLPTHEFRPSGGYSTSVSCHCFGMALERYDEQTEGAKK